VTLEYPALSDEVTKRFRVKNKTDETIVKKFKEETKTKLNDALLRKSQQEILTRFCVKQLTIENSKSWFAQKIAALLRELKLPEYPQGPANIPVTTPSNQVNIVSEPDVQQKTVKAAVMRNCLR
jgi:transcription initiation factor TFIIIB Brf1 subunit/transcription initiation factor TFIIB